MNAKSTIAIFGSGSDDHGRRELAAALGALVAQRGFHLLTGGGRGVMADAARGFTSSEAPNRGLSIGIIPRAATDDGPKSGYPNPWIELPIFTHLVGHDPASSESRNPINVLTARAALALPGGAGTLAEIDLARRYGVPFLAVVDEARGPFDAVFRERLEEIGFPPAHARRREHGGLDLRMVEAFLRSAEREPKDGRDILHPNRFGP